MAMFWKEWFAASQSLSSARVRTVGFGIPNHDELLWILIGKRAIERDIHRAEDGGVGADA
jgi:hypothetical protein